MLVVCVLFSGDRAMAQDMPEARKVRDQAEFAAVNTTGNTDVFTLSFKNNLEYDFSDTYTGTWNLAALYGEQDDEKNAERYSSDLRLDCHVTVRTYLYLLGGWLRDEFAGFENRYHVGPGIGRKFIDGPTHSLRAEIGANWAREDYVVQDTEDFLEGRGFGHYAYAIAEGNKFTQSIEYLHDFKDNDNFKILTVTAVTSALTKALAIKIAYEVRYQNRPVPDDLKKTDTIFSASLVVSY